MLMIGAGMFLVLVCIDMGVKQYIEDTFEENEERETVLQNVVLRKVYNRGFAFNVLDRYPEIIRKSSICATVWILVYDLWLFFRKKRRVHKLGMIFVTAGAFSNIYDRLIREKVIDYIGMKSKNSFLSNLTANLADIYIMVGTVLVTMSHLVHKKKKRWAGK